MKNYLTNNINSRDIKSPIREEYFAKHILWQLNGPHPTQSPIIVEDAIFFGISRIFVGQNLVKVCGTTVQYSFQPDVYLCNMSDQKSRGPVGVWGSGQAPASSQKTTNSHQKNAFYPTPPCYTFSGYLTKFRGSSSHFRLDNFSLQIFTQPVLFRTVVAFVYLFSTVYFQPPQIAVCFQMCPQSTCIRGCKITLVAFV